MHPTAPVAETVATAPDQQPLFPDEITLYDLEEVQHILHCGRTTLHHLIKNGTLDTVRLGRRVLVRHQDLVTLIDQRSRACGLAVPA